MILSLHDGLLQALASEQHAAAASALLQALQALLRGAPYHRLPEDLLPRTLEVQHGHACCQAVLQRGLQTKSSRLLFRERPTTAYPGKCGQGNLQQGIWAPERVAWKAAVKWKRAAGSTWGLSPCTQEARHGVEDCCCCMHEGRCYLTTRPTSFRLRPEF